MAQVDADFVANVESAFWSFGTVSFSPVGGELLDSGGHRRLV
jgi:hypothetical protein